MEVLRGADNFIDRHRPLIFAEFNPEWMLSRGFDANGPFGGERSRLPGFRSLP
jgi:hypothetical protein